MVDNLATPPILTARPCPAIPFDTRGRPLTGLGCCCATLVTRSWPLAALGCCCGSLATRGCPSSHPIPCQAMHQWENQPTGGRHPSRGGPELEGGVVKAGWWAHCQDPTNQGLQWPYLVPCFPLPSCLFLEEVDIQVLGSGCQAQVP